VALAVEAVLAVHIERVRAVGPEAPAAAPVIHDQFEEATYDAADRQDHRDDPRGLELG